MGSESIAHEAEGRMGYWLRGHEGRRNNCFKIERDSITWLIWRNQKFQKFLSFFEYKMRQTELIYTRQDYCIVWKPEVN